jgi:hypothetical protein
MSTDSCFYCPFCRAVIDGKLKRKCPACKEAIKYLNNPITGLKSYLPISTIEGWQLAIDALKMVQKEDALIDKYKPAHIKYGIPELYFDESITKAKETQSDSFSAIKNTIWSLLNQLAYNLGPSFDNAEHHLRLSEVYTLMVDLLHEQGRAHNHVSREMFLHELQHCKLTTDFQVRVKYLSKNCCSYCDSFNQHLESLDEAINNLTIASDNCTRDGRCNCTCSIIAIRDPDGRLISN